MLEDVRILFTADPENTKAILTTQFQDFGKGQQFHDEWHDFLGDSIFTTDGQQWHNSRQLIRPMFVREKVADLPLIEIHVRKLISLMGPGDGSAVMLNKLFFRFSLDAATHFLFGHSVGSLGELSHPAKTGFVKPVNSFHLTEDPCYLTYDCTEKASNVSADVEQSAFASAFDEVQRVQDLIGRLG